MWSRCHDPIKLHVSLQIYTYYLVHRLKELGMYLLGYSTPILQIPSSILDHTANEWDIRLRFRVLLTLGGILVCVCLSRQNNSKKTGNYEVLAYLFGF